MSELNFSVTVVTKGGDMLARVAERLKDMSPAFERIVDYWVKHNQDKFRQAFGAEATGAGVGMGGTEQWMPLTERYRERKHAHGTAKRVQFKNLYEGKFPDWLMVRTGKLLRTMTTRAAIASFVSGKSVAFGMPFDEEEQNKIRGNWRKRQVIFLDVADKNTIRGEFARHLDVPPSAVQVIEQMNLRMGFEGTV